MPQAAVDGITGGQIEGLGNYQFGGKAQTFPVNNSDYAIPPRGVGYWVAFAYPASFGPISTLFLNNETFSQVGAFVKASNPITVTTLTGFSTGYQLYVALADNAWYTIPLPPAIPNQFNTNATITIA